MTIDTYVNVEVAVENVKRQLLLLNEQSRADRIARIRRIIIRLKIEDRKIIKLLEKINTAQSRAIKYKDELESNMEEMEIHLGLK